MNILSCKDRNNNCNRNSNNNYNSSNNYYRDSQDSTYYISSKCNLYWHMLAFQNSNNISLI